MTVSGTGEKENEYQHQGFPQGMQERGMTDHTTETYKSNVATFLDLVEDLLKVDIPILRKFLDYLRDDLVYIVGKKKKGR